MQLEDLKAIVQTELEQDFDAIREEFLAETGNPSLSAFVAHLHAFGLISNALYGELAAACAEDEGGLFQEDPDEETVPGPTAGWDWDNVPQAHEEDETRPIGSSSRRADAPPAEEDTDGFPEESWDEVPTRGGVNRRARFRRVEGGLRETGGFDVEATGTPAAPRRRTRRHPSPDSSGGRYAFLGTAGEGAMGRVHVAHDSVLHRRVAFKSMSEDIRDQPTLAGKFTSEAQITAQLDHPNIVTVYELESDSAYTMKLVEGNTLADVLEEARAGASRRRPHGPHALDDLLGMFLATCDAVAYAHARGVIHRDLKPENVMVGAFREVYLMDWGIARVFDATVSEPVQVAPVDDEGDLVIGTPGYMSPEQAEGLNDELDGHSDQYALGLMLFEMLTLRTAVTGKTALKIVMRHQDGETESLTHIRRWRIPRELRAIVKRATQHRKQSRYADVKALADDVRRYLRGEAVRARPDGPLQALLRFMGRHRELTLVGIMLLFMGSGTVVAGVGIYAQYALSVARAREAQLSTLFTTVARQASLIDGQFLKYEGLLSVVAATATDMLARGTTEGGLYSSADFAEQATAPPDLVPSGRYGFPVSLGHPVWVEGARGATSAARADALRLTPMQRHFMNVLLRSHSEEAATYTPRRAERALVDVGVPLAWTYVGLESGAYLGYPGHGGFPDDYDHRDAPWYALARTGRGPQWGAPAPDPFDLGLMLSCTQALYDADERLLGVVGIDLTFAYLIEELLEAPEFEGAAGVEAFLLDGDGRVVVRSSKKGAGATSALRNRTLRMSRFDSEEVVAAVKERRSGYHERTSSTGRELIVYTRMDSIGWYYVVQGSAGALLDR